MAAAKEPSIHQLVKRNNRAAVSKLLDAKKELVSKRDTVEQSLLHIAAFEGFVDMAVLLLVSGANVNSADRNKWTPLHCAASSGQLQIIEILLDQGATPTSMNNEGSTALHYMVRFPVQKTDKPLFRRAVALMLEKNVDVNNQNLHGETPLHQACFRGRKLCVKMLLRNRANPNLRTKCDIFSCLGILPNRFGETGLHFAARKGDATIVRLLLAHGADAYIKGDMGTPRDVAYSCHHKHLVELFDALPPPPVKRSATPKSSPPEQYRPPSPGSIAPAILSKIFAFLDLEDISRAGRVCNNWHKAAKDQELWKRVYVGKLGRVRSKYKDSIADWQESVHRASSLQRTKGNFRALTGHTGKLSSVYVDEKANRLVSAATEIKVWDLHTLQCITTINRGGPYNCVQLDEQRVVCAAEDKTVKLWDLRSTQIIRTLLGHDGAVQRVQSDEQRLVSSGSDARLLLWDLGTGQQVRSFAVERTQFAIKSFHFERDRLAAGLISIKDGTHQLNFWNLRTGVLAHAVPKLHAIGVSFRRDWLIAARENRVKVWEMKGGHCLRTLRVEPKTAQLQACVRMENSIVTGDDAGYLRIYDIPTGHCWRSLQAHRDRVIALHCSGKLIASAGADGMVKLLEM